MAGYYVGATPVSALYAGATKVWPPAAPFSPSSVAGLRGWWKADAITGISDGGLVASWPDSSGSGATASQPFDLKPTYETGELNGQPVVRFGGGSDKALRADTAYPNGPETVFAVFRPNSAGVTGTNTIRGGEVQTMSVRLVNGRLDITSAGTAVIGQGTTVLTANAAIVAAFAMTPGSSWAVYRNGALDGSGSTPHSYGPRSTSTLGASGIFGQERFEGDLAEFLSYSGVLSSADRNAVTAYLGAKYGIAIT